MLSILSAPLERFAAACQPPESFFGFPTWYRYLEGQTDAIDPTKCIPKIDPSVGFQGFLAIGLGIVDMVLYLGGIVAVVFVIYGGFLYMTSQGEADKTAAAKNTILNAIIGLIIVLFSVVIVGWVGRQFNG